MAGLFKASAFAFFLSIVNPAFSQQAATGASDASPKKAEGIQCKNGKEVREILVKSLAPGKKVPCEVIYKKADGEKVIYSAQAQEGYCEMKATEFSEKLAGLGFNCEL